MTPAVQPSGVARGSPAGEFLDAGERRIPMMFVRSHRARRYILRLHPEGWARVTVPRGGSAAEARRFAERHTGWLKRQLERLAAHPPQRKEWLVGTEILFRGESVKIETVAPESNGLVRVGGEGTAAEGPEIRRASPIDRASGDGSQPKIAVGFVLAAGNGFAELADHPGAAVRARLPDFA